MPLSWGLFPKKPLVLCHIKGGLKAFANFVECGAPRRLPEVIHGLTGFGGSSQRCNDAGVTSPTVDSSSPLSRCGSLASASEDLERTDDS